MNQQLPETVYSPDRQLPSRRKFLWTIWSDIKSSRFLAWRLFIRNLSAQYRQTALGYIWLFLPPIATTIIWVFLNSQRILAVGNTELPYPLFVLTGTLLWQGFVDALQAPGQTFRESKGMLSKINFPHEALLLAAIAGVIFNFLIRLMLLGLVYFWYEIPLSNSMILAPLAILALIFFGIMVGVALLPLTMLFGDVQRLIMLVTPLWFFLTPVVYPTPTQWPASLLVLINPVSPLLVTARQWLTGTEATHITAFLLVSSLTVVLICVGWLVYRLAMPHLIERIGS